MAGLIRRAKICLIPHSKSLLTPYATDKSVWKLNEYLFSGKTVVASGVTMEEKRKNLVVVKSGGLGRAVRENLRQEPENSGPRGLQVLGTERRYQREAYENI